MADSSIGKAEQRTLVVVGAATRDIAPDDPRGWKIGGGVTYSAIAAARLPIRVRALIGIDDTAANAHEIASIRAAGVEVSLVPLASGPIFDNRRTPAGRVQYALAASDRLTVASLPPAWRSPDAALLAPVAGELSEEWSTAFAPATFVTLAAQGLLRRLDPGQEVVRLAFEHGPVIHRADAIALSPEDIVAGAPPIRDWTRPGQTVLVTHGKRGSLRPDTHGQRHKAAASCHRCRRAGRSIRQARVTRSWPRGWARGCSSATDGARRWWHRQWRAWR